MLFPSVAPSIESLISLFLSQWISLLVIHLWGSLATCWLSLAVGVSLRVSGPLSGSTGSTSTCLSSPVSLCAFFAQVLKFRLHHFGVVAIPGL